MCSRCRTDRLPALADVFVVLAAVLAVNIAAVREAIDRGDIDPPQQT